MKELLVVKEKIKMFVGKYEMYIMPVLKFLLTFIVVNSINTNIGYMAKISSKSITLILALAGSFLPMNLTMVIIGLLTVAHVYALSLECAIVVLALFLILFLLYFRFSSKDSIGAMLVPVSFIFKIPYVIPVSMGLVGTLSSMVSVSCGAVVYQTLHYINVNAETLKGVGVEGTKLNVVKTLIDGVILNKAMILYAVAFAVTVAVVYLIRRLSIDYSWLIAIGAGSITCFIVMLIGNAKLAAGVSMGGAFVGMLISIILNIILQYFCFDLNYNRTERVQFEDDEYYYYVKAVPKNTIALPESKPQKKPSRKPLASPAHKKAPVRRTPSSEAPMRVAPSTQQRRPVQAKPAQQASPANAREVVRKTASEAARAHNVARTPYTQKKEIDD